MGTLSTARPNIDGKVGIMFFLLVDDIMGILYGKYDVMDGDIFYHVY